MMTFSVTPDHIVITGIIIVLFHPQYYVIPHTILLHEWIHHFEHQIAKCGK